jgi:hypothetical protein
MMLKCARWDELAAALGLFVDLPGALRKLQHAPDRPVLRAGARARQHVFESWG